MIRVIRLIIYVTSKADNVFVRIVMVGANVTNVKLVSLIIQIVISVRVIRSEPIKAFVIIRREFVSAKKAIQANSAIPVQRITSVILIAQNVCAMKLALMDRYVIHMESAFANKTLVDSNVETVHLDSINTRIAFPVPVITEVLMVSLVITGVVVFAKINSKVFQFFLKLMSNNFKFLFKN